MSLLSSRPAVTSATPRRAATDFAPWGTDALKCTHAVQSFITMHNDVDSIDNQIISDFIKETHFYALV